MTGTNAAIRSMKSKIGKLDKETLKQQEIMYNQVILLWQLIENHRKVRKKIQTLFCLQNDFDSCRISKSRNWSVGSPEWKDRQLRRKKKN